MSYIFSFHARRGHLDPRSPSWPPRRVAHDLLGRRVDEVVGAVVRRVPGLVDNLGLAAPHVGAPSLGALNKFGRDFAPARVGDVDASAHVGSGAEECEKRGSCRAAFFVSVHTPRESVKFFPGAELYTAARACGGLRVTLPNSSGQRNNGRQRIGAWRTPRLLGHPYPLARNSNRTRAIPAEGGGASLQEEQTIVVQDLINELDRSRSLSPRREAFSGVVRCRGSRQRKRLRAALSTVRVSGRVCGAAAVGGVKPTKYPEYRDSNACRDREKNERSKESSGRSSRRLFKLFLVSLKPLPKRKR